MIEDAVEDLIGLAMQALNLPDPDGDEQNGSNYGKDSQHFKAISNSTTYMFPNYLVNKYICF